MAALVIFFGSGPAHHHCDFCSECLDDGFAVTFTCGSFFIERDGQAPDEFEAGTWYACTACASDINNGNTEGIITRVTDRFSPSDSMIDEARRTIDSFNLFRSKKENASG